MFTNFANVNPSGFDAPMTLLMSQGCIWVNPYIERLVVGDIDKFGPRGNNQYSFATWEFVPEQYLTGDLAESWEVQPDGSQYIFHIRKGVMWTGNQKIGMASRELTGEDVASSLRRDITRPGFAGSFTWIKSITATDKYTVVWACNNFFANWPWRIGGGTALGAIMAPESINAGAENWQNAVGTGPFIITDYVDGSGATYKRNPNYWGKTTINGKEYQEPFIDTLRYPIIADVSTQVAALRTAKLDWAPKVSLTYGATLASSSPDLIMKKYMSNTMQMLKFNRLTSKYFTDKNLRRALMIGTDLNAIAKLVYTEGEVVSWPLSPADPGYVSLDKLPASQKELYTYDPVKAKQLVAAAGYPNGFKMEITIGNDSVSGDLANACVSMWAKFGVTATVNVLEATPLASANEKVTYPDCETYTSTVANPLTALGLCRSDVAGATYKAGEPLMQMDVDALATIDPVKRTAIEQQLGLAFLDDVGVLPFTNPYVLNCYWPWMKNYYGELEAGYYNGIPMIKRMWIDQNLKKSLGK